jgi:hypothetical protein
VTGGQGLQATYQTGARIQGAKKAFDRVDRQVMFNFGEGSPDPERIEAGRFHVEWRGSVIADETGDHEFIVRTPNGMRLYVNSDETPLIDAYVATGTISEHRATLRLIGGRAYPIQLDFFKFKDKTASIELLWKPPHGALMPVPARNLSPERVSPTFVLKTPFPADDSSVGYERGVSVSKAWDEAATQAAIEVANHLVARLDRLTGTKPDGADRAAKVRALAGQFVEAAFRRPLTAEQKRLFVTAHFEGRAAPKPEDALKRAVLSALKSPRFLYLGLDNANPDDFAVAERLAYGLWDSLPDRDLLKAAADGVLRSREQVLAQARRMTGDPRARAKVRGFFEHWLQMNHVEDFAKDPTLYPGFTPETIADLRASLTLFLDDVFWSETSDYRRLLLEDELFVNRRLAEFYGLEAGVADDFVRAAFEPAHRAGVVTHPYLLAAFAYPKSSSPIHRGVFLTRNIVGRALKPPPVAVAFKDEEFDPNLTMREKVATLTRSESCQSCHSVINPLGFSLEQFDAVGRFRTSENGRPIDATGDYATDDGEAVRFNGARDLAQFAAASEQAQNGFIEQLFHQVVKQPLLAYGAGTPDRLRESFTASGYNMRQLLVEIATLSARHGIEKPKSSKKP